jgi:TonB family protein
MPSSGSHRTENRKSRVIGVFVTVFVHLVVSFFFLRMALLSVVPEPSLTIEVVMEPEPEPKRLVEKVVPKPLPAVKKVNNTPPVSTKPAVIDDQGDVDVPVEKKPEPVEIDKRALFQSSDAGTNADNASGDNIDSSIFSASGNEPNANASDDVPTFDLSGRSIVGKLEQPANTSNREGRVVVGITVDQSGKVIQARARVKGSTIQDAALWKAAEDAARQTVFNTDFSSPPLQMGTITYVFKLK